ncbi:hypothetical protein XELAEV_18001231mg [Xenopus laevis]|nr:hypothetical protein XELAEV_18001231mg [Xenopus laevis]
MEIGGLPPELWRLIPAYLPLHDLEQCGLVYRSWFDLILSLDNTRWRQLCLGCVECRHPNWPIQPDVEPRSWREAFKQHYVASRTWTKNAQDLESSNCLYSFRRKKDRRVLHVGHGSKEITLKIPVEIMGQGKLGDVALLVCIDQQCPTSRLCNLVVMPAWFSPVMFKTSIGHVQFDNCNFENGQLLIHAPGTCQVKFCTFNQSSIHFHNVALSILFNAPEASHCGPGSTDYLGNASSGVHLRTCEIMVNTSDTENEINGNIYRCKEEEAVTLDKDYSESDVSTNSENEDEQSVYKLSYHSHGLSHVLAKSIQCRPQSNGLLTLQGDMSLKSLQHELQRDKELQTLVNTIQGCLIRKCLFRDGKGGVFICSQGQARLEGSIFRDLTYAVRCIQNSKVDQSLYHSDQINGNHIFQGLAAGIAVNENGRGQITENVIRENQWGGVDIRRGGDPVLCCNLICCGYSDGERGKGLIEGNTIYGNKGCGVWIMSSSLPHITSNQIGHNSIYGVAVFCRKDDARDYLANQAGNENFNDDGEAANWENDLDSEDDRFSSRRPINVALIESNCIIHNGAAGLYIKSSEALNIMANAIHANKDCGVAVFQSTQLTRIGNNSISCNRLSGVQVEAGCRVELRGNGIYDNRSHGLISKGDGIILENDIIGNRGCGIQLIQTADMKVTRNRIQSVHDFGIAILDLAKGLVQENTIFQGKSRSNILHEVSNFEDCIVQHNKLLTFKKKGVSSMQSTQRVATVTTRIAARVEGRCHNNGSIFCTIL